MTQSPTMADILARVVENAQASVWTALPGRVEEYDAATQFAAVQPLVTNTYYDENEERRSERLPVVQDVPVMFQGAGDYSITFPIKQGDVGLLVFTSCSLDQFLARGTETDLLSDPGGDRRNHLSDAVFIPGLRARPQALANAATDALVVTADRIKLGGDDADDPVVRRSDLAAVVSDFNDVLAAHKHLGVTTGSGISGVADSLTDVSTPACSDVVRSR